MERNPVKAIRLKCLDCSCDNPNEVRECPVTDCALYPFRMGTNPYRQKREYTEEQKKAMVERLKNGGKKDVCQDDSAV